MSQQTFWRKSSPHQENQSYQCYVSNNILENLTKKHKCGSLRWYVEHKACASKEYHETYRLPHNKSKFVRLCLEVTIWLNKRQWTIIQTISSFETYNIEAQMQFQSAYKNLRIY